jgi:hypothetical protein
MNDFQGMKAKIVNTQSYVKNDFLFCGRSANARPTD